MNLSGGFTYVFWATSLLSETTLLMSVPYMRWPLMRRSRLSLSAVMPMYAYVWDMDLWCSSDCTIRPALS